MEAVTVAGIAVVLVGGVYSAIDFLEDLGIAVKKTRVVTRAASFNLQRVITPQRRVKKMAGVNV